jgi:hypothetical protein
MGEKRQITKDEGQLLACELNCSFLELTAKDKTSVRRVYI